jgi:hypothetical protein
MSAKPGQDADLALLASRPRCHQPAEVLLDRAEAAVNGDEPGLDGADPLDQVADAFVQPGLQRADLCLDSVHEPVQGPSEDRHERGAEDTGNQLPDLSVVHLFKIGHLPRAVERHACNYRVLQ